MIPKRVHYCWFGSSPKSPLNERCIESWRKVMPEYQIKEWNETNSPLDGAYARAAYAGGLWSKLSNYIRLYALYEEGGIYLDTDVEVIRDFSPLLNKECFVGFQQKEKNPDWVNNAVLGARPEHPFLKSCMNMTEEAFRRKGVFYRSPVVTTAVLREWGLRDYGLQEIQGVTVYPTEYFYPYPWHGRFSPDCIGEDTYCIHYWEGTWLKKGDHKALSPFRIMKRAVRALLPRSSNRGNLKRH